MSELFIHEEEEPRFVWDVHLKSMYSSLRKSINEYFGIENIERIHGEILDLYVRAHKLQDAPSISIVRNPYSKIISFFYNKVIEEAKEKLDEEDTYANIHEKIARRFNWNIYENREKVLNRFINFEFNEFIYHYKRMIREDPHTRPQTTYIADYEGNIKIDHVFKMENINEKWSQIQDILGEDLPLYHINENKSKRPPYQEVYTDATKELVSELYKADLELLDYSF